MGGCVVRKITGSPFYNLSGGSNLAPVLHSGRTRPGARCPDRAGSERTGLAPVRSSHRPPGWAPNDGTTGKMPARKGSMGADGGTKPPRAIWGFSRYFDDRVHPLFLLRLLLDFASLLILDSEFQWFYSCIHPTFLLCLNSGSLIFLGTRDSFSNRSPIF